MARDGVFFRKLAEVHPRFGTPAFSVLVSSAWAIALAATGSFEQLFHIRDLRGVGLLCAGRSQRLRVAAAPSGRAPAVPRPWLPVDAARVRRLGRGDRAQHDLGAPQRSLLGLGIVALGLPAYHAWRRARAKAIALGSGAGLR